jgi:hypothetical protein
MSIKILQVERMRAMLAGRCRAVSIWLLDSVQHAVSMAMLVPNPMLAGCCCKPLNMAPRQSAAIPS